MDLRYLTRSKEENRVQSETPKPSSDEDSPKVIDEEEPQLS